ncbi:hypothetical protein ACPFUK_003370 [Vibrio cholerae]|uniref:hypothetical protein n=1 Tax=Vibrio cholerae TaxID=666 RepID=UPI002FDC3084
MLICPNCHYNTGGFSNKPAAIAFWINCNRREVTKDDSVFKAWVRDYQAQSHRVA